MQADYLITLDKIDPKHYSEILQNQKQIQNWIELGMIENNQIELKDKPTLPLDTAFFDEEFKNEILSEIDNLDEQTNGLLIKSENWQALNLLKEKYRGKVKCIYIDPPFNLGENGDFLYKTDYVDSSWLALLENRIRIAKEMLSEDGSIFVRCDYHGNYLVRQLLDEIFGSECLKNELHIARGRNEAGSPSKLETTTESLFFYAKQNFNLFKITTKRSIANIKWTGFTMGGDRNPPERVFLGKTIYPKRGQHFALIQEKVDKLLNEKYLRIKCKKCGCYYFKSQSDYELNKYMKDKNNRFKFYDITNATTYHGVEIIQKCMECANDEEFDVQYLGSEDVYLNNNWLDVEGYSNTTGFSTENAEVLLERVIKTASEEGDLVMDFFMRSGTTQAVAHKLGRKYIGVEMGEYFGDYALPRIKKVINGDNKGISKDIKWKGQTGIVKYLTLEQYEDVLDNLETKVEGLPDSLPFKYWYTPESLALDNNLDLKKPFENKTKIGKEQVEVVVDLAESYNYLRGYEVKKNKNF